MGVGLIIDHFLGLESQAYIINVSIKYNSNPCSMLWPSYIIFYVIKRDALKVQSISRKVYTLSSYNVIFVITLQSSSAT